MVEDIHFKLFGDEIEIIKKLLKFPPDLTPTAKDIKNFLLSEKTDDKKEHLKYKIDRQKYLKLCLENWLAMKSSGHIMEEAKAILTGEKEIEEPTIKKLKDFEGMSKIQKEQLEITEKIESSFDENNYCDFCKHTHATTEPQVCTNIDCKCGIR